MKVIRETISTGIAAHQIWDVVVVGAGPAGAMAAHEMARKSVSVLLVDQAVFPRNKVCGSYFNKAALSLLEEVGLGYLPYRFHARPVNAFCLFVGKKRGDFPLPGGVVLSRKVFDVALVGAAVEKGAQFLPGTRASLQGIRKNIWTLRFYQGIEATTVQARVILVANGLSGNFLRDGAKFKTQFGSTPRVGLGTVASNAPSFYSPGKIFMGCGRKGYVGLVRFEDDTLDIAAALDPTLIQEMKNPGVAVARILRESNLPLIDDMEKLAWRGTPVLARRRRPLAYNACFLLGDAAGYVEPFTGEGIAWALASGIRVAPLAFEAVQAWRPSLAGEWNRLYSRVIGSRQKICSVATQLLKQPVLIQAALQIFAWKPSFAEALVRSINSPFGLEYPS